MHIGARILAARRRLKPKVTQRQIADLFGITPQAVAGWEAGDTEPEKDKYPQLRNILRVTYAWLLEGDGPPPDPTDAEVLLEDRALAAFRASAAKNAPKPTKPVRRA